MSQGSQFRSTVAEISLSNLESNYLYLKSQLSEGNFFCPMVKAFAYGHDDVIVAEKLTQLGCETIGVNMIEEAVRLRQAHIKSDILVFGPFDSIGAEEIVDSRLTPVISQWNQLEILNKLSDGSLGVHIKFNTGMNRLGFDSEDKNKVLEYIKSHKKLKVLGLLTHLHSGEDLLEPESKSLAQLQQLKSIYEDLKKIQPHAQAHALNSSSLLRYNQLPGTLSWPDLGARPGIALYGAASSKHLKPVMSLKSQAVQLHRLKKNTGTSYNHTWKAQVDSLIAIVPCGYADGVHRVLSNKAEVLVGDTRCPLVGNVCMDYFMVDVTKLKKTEQQILESDIYLFGGPDAETILPVEEQALRAQTISYEMLTSVSRRVPRKAVG